MISKMNETIPFGLYLWTRIHQLGTQSVMGVPGDMNLELLDYIKQVHGLRWIGNANELNAAYAADGYARVKDCPGVLSTTMGVGELSAINGVAGAYTEQVKMIHIVGTTTTTVQAQRKMIHHCLGANPDHRIYDKISAHVRCAHTWIEDESTAAAEVDRVLHECIIQSLPVYIFVPMDFVHFPVSAKRLETPIDLSYPVDQDNEKFAIESIIHELSQAKNPILLVDALTHRHGAVEEARELADLLDFPTFTTPYGKSIISETHPYWCGIYNGRVSDSGIQDVVEKSDCVLNIGPFLSDSNTGGHTRSIDPTNLIMINPNNCTIRGQEYNDVYLRPLLQRLLIALRTTIFPKRPYPILPERASAADANATEIVQSWIWRRLGEFCQPGDIIIAESGTAQFGFPDAILPEGAQYITQGYFAAIGYAVPPCLGAALAQEELQPTKSTPQARTLLLVGDGSLQLTVQEVGTMIRHKLKPIIFVINNNGYTIERAIHGPEEVYNDITQWRHQKLLDFFGAEDGQGQSREVRTKVEMEQVLALPEYTNPQSIQLLEVYMGVMDFPWRLTKQIEIIKALKKAKTIN